MNCNRGIATTAESDDGLECHKLMAFSSYVKPKVALALV